MISPFSPYNYDNRVFFESIPATHNASYADCAEEKFQGTAKDSFFGFAEVPTPQLHKICGIECEETPTGLDQDKVSENHYDNFMGGYIPKEEEEEKPAE